MRPPLLYNTYFTPPRLQKDMKRKTTKNESKQLNVQSDRGGQPS